MAGLTVFTPSAVFMYLGFIVMQVTAVMLLPKSEGFTNMVYTIPLLALFIVSMGMLAQLIHKGLPLGVALPVASAIVPLVIIVLGILLYQESHSLPKLALLCSACVMVGFASAMR